MEKKIQNCQTCDGDCENCYPEDFQKVLSKKQSFLILLVIAIIGTVIGYLQSKQEPKTAMTKSETKLVSESTAESLHQQFFIMGTIFDCTFFDKDVAKRENARNAVLAELKRIETLCNIFDNKSEIYQLNSQAHVKPFKCSDELWEILQKSRWAYEISDGNFDISAKVLMDLWGFYRKQDKVPSDKEIADALKFVGLEKVVFDDQAKTVFFKEKGFAFDLGGIAKGIAVDKAMKSAEKFDLDGILINLGGNISCYGKTPPYDNYSVAIRNPLKKDDFAKVITLSNESVATSGNYERFVKIGDKTYSHIMNVKNGRPVENVLSVTVVTKSAGDADIFSTATFIGGEEYAKKLVSLYPDLRIYAFTLDKEKNVVYKEFNNETIKNKEVQK